jgi:ABC-type branched-subunit amino acid transport system substrate-binding protein
MSKRVADAVGGLTIRRPWPLLGLVVVALTLTTCSLIPPRRSEPVVKIGLVAPFEGRYREVGYDVIYSARLAIREANQASGPGQTKVLLTAVDDFGDPEIARQSAEAMTIDPDVMAVIGHWRPQTTAAARPIYQSAGLAFVEAGQGDFGPTDPSDLAAGFLRAYEDVTPFDETAGPYAGSAYDGLRLILAAMEEIEAGGGAIDRASVSKMLESFSFVGITGTVRNK